MNIYTSKKCLEHRLYPIFSEKPERLSALFDLFREEGHSIIETKPAKREWVRRIHESGYIDAVESGSKKNLIGEIFNNLTNKYFQSYMRVSPGSYDAALYAAGAVCTAVEDVAGGHIKTAFCAVRPPGHHAAPAKGEGFCLFNNAAIGAAHALALGIDKVAIIDIDRHHGNGTQAIVGQKMNGQCLLASSYQDGCKYSGTPNFSDNIIKVPLPQHSDFTVVKSRYQNKVIPALNDFKPELIIISAGFDTHKDDPLTNLKMESSDFYAWTRLLTDAANDLCDGRVVSVLEGGYEIEALTECVHHHLRALSPDA